MTVHRDTVVQMAKLARIAIDKEEIAALEQQFNKIISLVDALQAVPTDGIAPMAHPLDMQQRLRADEITECDERAWLQTSAPEVTDGYYLVPEVIDDK